MQQASIVTPAPQWNWSPRAAVETPAPTNTMPSWLLAGYLFLITSATHEVIAYHTGVAFPLIAVCFLFVAIPYLFSGEQLRFLRTPFAFPWVALLAWWGLSSIFGFYPRRSVDYLWLYALRLHSIPLLFTALARDTRTIWRLLCAGGFGLLALLGYLFLWGATEEGRLLLPGTSMSNANDLALRILMHLGMLVTFWKGGTAMRTLALLAVPVSMLDVVRTGSRGGFVTMLVLMAVCFFVLPLGKRVLLLVVGAGVIVAALPMLSPETLAHLTTFTTSDSQGDSALLRERSGEAANSTLARLDLQKRAIELTARHPLFGVGPLNFEDAVEEMVQSTEHHKSGWQVSHNSYLQVSSESGVPGLIFYIWSIGLCVVLNFRSFRRLKGQDRLNSFSLLLASVSYAVGVLFCSIAYDYYLALLVGLTAANEIALARNKTSVQPAAPSAPSAPAPRPSPPEVEKPAAPRRVPMRGSPQYRPSL